MAILEEKVSQASTKQIRELREYLDEEIERVGAVVD